MSSDIDMWSLQSPQPYHHSVTGDMAKSGSASAHARDEGNQFQWHRVAALSLPTPGPLANLVNEGVGRRG